MDLEMFRENRQCCLEELLDGTNCPKTNWTPVSEQVILTRNIFSVSFVRIVKQQSKICFMALNHQPLTKLKSIYMTKN